MKNILAFIVVCGLFVFANADVSASVADMDRDIVQLKQVGEPIPMNEPRPPSGNGFGGRD